jgi:hypothetical protein
MGSTLLGVLRKTLWWSSTGQMFKTLILKYRVFQTGNGRKTGKRTVMETITGTGAGMATGAGTGNVFDPSNAGNLLQVNI